MGLDTEFVIFCELKSNLPEQTLRTLKWLCGEIEDPGNIDKDDEITKCFSYRMLAADGSYYFAQGNNTILYFDPLAQTYHLSARTVIRNTGMYQGEKFVYWLAPYILKPGFIGYRRVEADDDLPTLLYIDDNNKPFLVTVLEKQRLELSFLRGQSQNPLF